MRLGGGTCEHASEQYDEKPCHVQRNSVGYEAKELAAEFSCNLSALERGLATPRSPSPEASGARRYPPAPARTASGSGTGRPVSRETHTSTACTSHTTAPSTRSV